MPLSDAQKLTLLLAGTTAIPSPPPATGTVYNVFPDEDEDVDDPASLFLKVAHVVSPRLTLNRFVRLTDVRAINGAWPPEPGERPTDPPARTFKAGPALIKLVLGCVSERRREVLVTEAVVYVADSAPVLLQVEAGMTAAESADYYPPLPGLMKSACPTCPPGGGAHGRTNIDIEVEDIRALSVEEGAFSVHAVEAPCPPIFCPPGGPCGTRG